MPKAVRFDEYGGIDVLQVVEVPRPVPGPGQVLVRGNAAAASASVLAELAGLIAAGQLEIPVAAVFPRAKVQDAYRRLEQGHLLGKIALEP